MQRFLCVIALAAVSSTALATTVTTYNDSVAGGIPEARFAGIPNDNFVVNTNTAGAVGVQTGLMSLERFVGDLPNTQNRYFAQTGTSADGGPGSPTEAGALGNTTWDYFMSVDLGASGLTFNDVYVNVSIDFNPAAGNTDFLNFELVSSIALFLPPSSGLSFDPAVDTLIQDSENLGFQFWQAAAANFPGVTGILPIDPFATGEYYMSIEVVRKSDGMRLSFVDMTTEIQSVPLPMAASMGLVGLGVIGARRRRR